MISTTHHLRGYVRHLPRLKAEGQTEALQRHGVPDPKIYTEGKNGESLETLIRSLRKGQAVAVVRLHILAPPKLRTADQPRRALWAAIKAIEAKGASIIEVESGRSTANKSERDDMIADAIEALTHSGRSPRRRDGAGRPPKVFTAEQIEQARTAWFDLRHRTNRDAVAASPKGWAMTRSYKKFGPSSRDN
jgi:hypothetical protein